MQRAPDVASLENLQDIVEPVPLLLWWPPTPAGWAVLAVVLVVLAALAWRSLRKFRRNTYRRAALHELDGAQGLDALPGLLKRVALAAYPREDVAGLSGRPWIDFLNRQVPASFDAPTGALLLALDYGPADGIDLTERDRAGLSRAVRQWTKKHRSRRAARP